MSSFKLDLENDRNVLSVSEFIKDRLYFVTLKNKSCSNTMLAHYFTIDGILVYKNFFNDFGPHNISAVYKYNQELSFKLWSTELKNKKIVHFTTGNAKNRVNAAFLIGTFAIFYLGMSPKDVLKQLTTYNLDFLPFQDASPVSPHCVINLLDCLSAFKKAITFGFVNLNDFSLDEFNKYESMKNGDMSWIVPHKLLAFSGPWDNPPGKSYHTPTFYIEHFKRIGIRTVIRLNDKAYSAEMFKKAGINHHDLYFPDGTCPSEEIMKQFLHICESTPYAVAVHCKAGLGRTGCLVGAYLIKHFHMSALEAIAWMRICRPGCVIGAQQLWLQGLEDNLLSLGDSYRARYRGGRDKITHFKFGIYSLLELSRNLPLSNIVPFEQFPKEFPNGKQKLTKMEPLDSGLRSNKLSNVDKLNIIKHKKNIKKITKNVKLNAS